MIDWWRVCTNGLWVAGLAIIVGLFGHIDWQAARRDDGTQDALRRTWHHPGLALGLSLTCLGIGLSVWSWAERALWLALAAAFAAQAAWRRRGLRKEAGGDHAGPID
ncbi:MAG: hypothetical protein ACOYZ7_20215 [Chloroflexota bacterium]